MARTPHSSAARLLVGAVALVVIAAGAALVSGSGTPTAVAGATADDCLGCRGFATGQPLREPQRLVTRDGRLAVTLTARLSQTTIGGRRVRSMVYNGQFPGPTLVVDPGDDLDVLLRNRMRADYLPYGASAEDPPPIFPGQPYAGFPQPLGQLTNLHVHGMHVSPKQPQDDIFLSLKPGERYQYRYDLPEDHPPGLYWYHPHRHEYVDMQTFAGQAGAIIVRGGLDAVPGVKGLRERLMVIQSTEVRDGATTGPQYRVPQWRAITFNGQVQPRIDLKPGETQRWRIVNATNERFLQMIPMGGVDMWEIARDGNSMARPNRVGLLFLSPGQRLEVLVRAKAEPGEWGLVQTYFNQRPTPYGKQPRVTVATIRVAGEAVEPQPVPATLLPVEDLRGDDVEIARRREIRFTQSPPKFYINGKLFFDDHGRVGPTLTTKLGTIEEWVLFNDSPEWHNFHLHVDPYQVVARNGRATTGAPYWADSIAVPPKQRITIRVPFRDFAGDFVMHCHVLVHEDHGMMTVVRVVE
jgi:FtsP/CotA-like multicopper oxidase with cupredoxin domain